eukprot:TRINITY_DN8380_c0_g1_i10.p1 TRINITY_DN8380_c0_g1~~TRINITY_DN8380_c0_g1_i10.p1  ORF type:complete len:288 (+),score=8.87 TRINITY_DN8380_c0_g1_i10:91-864(+)
MTTMYSLGSSTIAELILMTLYIYTTCGTIITYSVPFKDLRDRQPNFTLHLDTTYGILVPTVFGLSTAILAYSGQTFEAGQLNPIISISLLFIQQQQLMKTFMMILAQMTGSLTAIGLLYMTSPNAANFLYGANSVSQDYSQGNAVVGELVMTFTLIIVVLQAQAHKQKEVLVPLTYGITVFVAHIILLPIDGCSLNLARSFGPALVTGDWSDFWIYLVGPFFGGLMAIGLNQLNEIFKYECEQEEFGENANQTGSRI